MNWSYISIVQVPRIILAFISSSDKFVLRNLR